MLFTAALCEGHSISNAQSWPWGQMRERFSLEILSPRDGSPVKLEKGQGKDHGSGARTSEFRSVPLAATQLSGPGQSCPRAQSPLPASALLCFRRLVSNWQPPPRGGNEGASQRGAFGKMLFLLMWGPFEASRRHLLPELQLDRPPCQQAAQIQLPLLWTLQGRLFSQNHFHLALCGGLLRGMRGSFDGWGN